MLVMRKGATKDRGLTHIKIKPDIYQWHKDLATLELLGMDVADFSRRNHHNYTVSLDVGELTSVLKALADAALADPDQFEKDFGGSLESLMILQAVAAGLKVRR